MLWRASKITGDTIGNVATIFEKINIGKINSVLIYATNIRNSFNYKTKSMY